mgnify:CR=1 FL=1|jgi:hypothetical protein|tara:strand:+ start:782 stop:1492 length:711 start_codon:yes stop_codon:yes gene_type:complete
MARKTIELEVPTTLADIKLWQYQKYMKVVDAHKEAEETEELNNFLNMKLVEIFCNISLKDVSKISVRGYKRILDILNKAFEEKPKLIQRFDLEGVDMGFIPKLDDISLGEYIDIETNLPDWQKIHKAMAVLYRPVNFKLGNKYTIAPYEVKEEIQEVMKQMPMNVVISSTVFFYNLGKALLGAIPKYMEKNLTKESMQQLGAYLEKNGDGINQFMHSLKETSASFKKLRSYHFSNV